MTPYAIALGLLTCAATSQAAVVYSGEKNIILHANDAISINIEKSTIYTTTYGYYASSGHDANNSGWDIAFLTSTRTRNDNSTYLFLEAYVPAHGQTIRTYSSSVVAKLAEGETINSTTGTFGSDSRSNYTISAESTSYYPFSYSSGIGYIGLKFLDSGGELHYGWVGLNFSSEHSATPTIVSWAYESTPNTAIAAGAVPEPATAAIVAIAGAGALLKRRRKAYS